MKGKRALFGLFALALVGAVLSGAGCTNASDNGGSNGNGQNGNAGDNGGDTDNADADNGGSGDMSQSEMEHEAVRTAQAWFVARTDFTSDQFEFAVEGFVEADEGSYYARVSATPNDASMETEQIYVEKPADRELWYPIDMGTGIDPATDERFPEEVRAQLQP